MGPGSFGDRITGAVRAGLRSGAAVLWAAAGLGVLGLVGLGVAQAQDSNHIGDTVVLQGGEGEVYIAGLPAAGPSASRRATTSATIWNGCRRASRCGNGAT